MSDATLLPTKFKDVTPSDSASLGNCIGLYVGGAGTVVVKGANDVQATFTVPAGATLSGRFSRVMAASTATGIVALLQ